MDARGWPVLAAHGFYYEGMAKSMQDNSDRVVAVAEKTPFLRLDPAEKLVPGETDTSKVGSTHRNLGV
ncbi:MAG: hypothetical protein CM15mP46_1160 [Alphaproteobacteria bacterium]|nr:MAG: hypothetical protein CM15mP46_1160 [Alphaproteobacteria bacterium]